MNARSLVAAVLCMLLAPVANAQPVDKWSVRVGGFVTRLDTTLRVDSPDGERGSVIDFDRELGLEDRQVIEFIGGDWRPAPNHQFGLEYFRESLSGSRQLDRDIRFSDETFALDSTAYSSLTLESFEFHYTYWPLQRETWALGFRFAFMHYRMHTQIEVLLAEAGEDPQLRIRADVSETLPVPSFGLDFHLAPAQRWRINANIGWFEAKFKRVQPLVATARIGIEYLAWENVGLWADFGLNHLDAEYRGRVDGAMKIYEGGLRVGVTFRP